MTLRARRILYSIAIIIFFVSAPPLVLYTAGFRYDFEYNRVVETGSLVVKSFPSDARILLDGEPYRANTPTIINDILPGKIVINVEKDGYYPYEKTVSIANREASFEDNIRLFPAAEPRPLIEDNVSQYWWNKKSDKLAYETPTGELKIYNFLNQKTTLIANTAVYPLVFFSWSEYDEQFVFARKRGGRNEYIVLDANRLESFINLDSASPIRFVKVQWDPAARNTLYGLGADGSLYRIPYLLQTSRRIWAGPITDFLAEKNRIVLLEKPAAALGYVSWISYSDPDTVHRVAEIAESDRLRLYPTNSHRIAAHDKTNGRLLLVDPSIKKNDAVKAAVEISKVKDIIWSRSGNYLIYTDGFGIYRKNFVNPITVIPDYSAEKLIARYTAPVLAIAFADDENYLLFSVDGSIRIAYLLADNGPEILKLAVADKAVAMISSDKHNLLFYLDSDNRLLYYPLVSQNSGAGLFRR